VTKYEFINIANELMNIAKDNNNTKIITNIMMTFLYHLKVEVVTSKGLTMNKSVSGDKQ